MVKKKNLEIGREYIYFYTSRTRPRVLEYIGMHMDEPLFRENNKESTRYTPRLSDIYKPENLTASKAREIVVTCFRHIW